MNKNSRTYMRSYYQAKRDLTNREVMETLKQVYDILDNDCSCYSQLMEIYWLLDETLWNPTWEEFMNNKLE